MAGRCVLTIKWELCWAVGQGSSLLSTGTHSRGSLGFLVTWLLSSKTQKGKTTSILLPGPRKHLWRHILLITYRILLDVKLTEVTKWWPREAGNIEREFDHSVPEGNMLCNTAPQGGVPGWREGRRRESLAPETYVFLGGKLQAKQHSRVKIG
jgi:hypothetical protein